MNSCLFCFFFLEAGKVPSTDEVRSTSMAIKSVNAVVEFTTTSAIFINYHY